MALERLTAKFICKLRSVRDEHVLLKKLQKGSPETFVK